MGFKADVSFLQKLTMGAAATRFAIDFLRRSGFSPIELERYCTSNKIWMTKVKRLRLADVLCVETGLRIEVRGKSDLSIRMSESPKNPDRRWDSGLRDSDLVCLVACDGGDDVRVRCTEPSFFSVADMRATAHLAKLGPPKSAGEGAERDLEWPNTVPSQDGEVVEVTADRIVAVMGSGRRQSYQLKGKVPYVKPGDRFTANVTILAGVVSSPIDVKRLRRQTWNPVVDLGAPAATDRYAAAKAVVSRGGADRRSTIQALESALLKEDEARTALEIAGSLAKLDADSGFDELRRSVTRADERFPSYLRMEAVLILGETQSAKSAEILDSVARNSELRGNELRQASVWGLGRKGVRAYDRLVSFIDDDENDVALHALAAFGSDTPEVVIQKLVDVLTGDGPGRAKAAASESLRLIGTSLVAERLIQAADSGDAWVVATLGRMSRDALAGRLSPSLQRSIEPVSLLSEAKNWLASRTVSTNFQFLLLQTL